MSSMKKSESKNLQDANVSAERAEQDESHEMLLHREWVELSGLERSKEQFNSLLT